MQPWFRLVRGVVGMGLVWAVGGVAVAGLIELVDNVAPAAHGFTRRVDMWAPVLAVLAFQRGALFAVLLGLARRGRRFEQFTMPEFAAWGAVAGLVLGGIALASGAGVVYFAVTTLLSAVAGAASLALARVAERRSLVAAGTVVAGADAPQDAPLLRGAEFDVHPPVDRAAERVADRVADRVPDRVPDRAG